MATKPKAKKGKKPPKRFHRKVQIVAGLKKAPTGNGDVSGHGNYPAYYACNCCGRWSFVPGGVYSFYCWSCWCYQLAP